MSVPEYVRQSVGVKHEGHCPTLLGPFECICGGERRAILEYATAQFVDAHPSARRVEGDCSCCGGESRQEYPVLRAALVDSDGGFYPRLCVGCYGDVEREIERAKKAGTYNEERAGVAAALVAAFPSEVDDGAVTTLEDAQAAGMF